MTTIREQIRPRLPTWGRTSCLPKPSTLRPYNYNAKRTKNSIAPLQSNSTCFIYEYGPFGEILRMTGPMANANPFRFSTKYQDDETDLLYYGYRYYNASTGRWLSRDPIGERGGKNLYGFVSNNGVQIVDTDGRVPLVPLVIGGLVVANVYYWYEALKPLPEPNPPAEMIQRPDGAQNFIVHGCSVVIVLGHSSMDYPHHFFFDRGHESCSGAAVTGCGSQASNLRIPPEARIPGAPMHTDDVLSTDPEYKQGIKDTRNGAVLKATNICKDPRQCCAQVRIYYFDAPKNGGTFEDDFHQIKKPMVEIFDCKKGRIIETINNYFLDDRTRP